MKQVPDTADVLFTRGPSLFSRITCRLTGLASHQATFYDSSHVVEATMSTGRVAKVPCDKMFAEMSRTKTEWIVFHWEKPLLTPELRANVQRDLDEDLKFERYSAIELPLQLIDEVINRWILRHGRRGLDAYVFRKLGNIWGNGVICSKTSNRSLIRNGFIPESSGLEYGSPADTYNYLFSRLRQEVVIANYSEGWFPHGSP